MNLRKDRRVDVDADLRVSVEGHIIAVNTQQKQDPHRLDAGRQVGPRRAAKVLRIDMTSPAWPALRRSLPSGVSTSNDSLLTAVDEICTATGQHVLLVMDDREIVEFVPQLNWLGRLLRLRIGVLPIRWRSCLRLLRS